MTERRDRGDEYGDLAEAVLRGGVRSSDELERPILRSSYVVELDGWDYMLAELLLNVVVDAGSVEEAAWVLELPAATLEARLEWIRAAPGCVREAYVIGLGPWREMIGQLLLAIVHDAGSARKAAPVLGVPRSTFSRWVDRARRWAD